MMTISHELTQMNANEEKKITKDFRNYLCESVFIRDWIFI
jgi:hypothetical protein